MAKAQGSLAAYCVHTTLSAPTNQLVSMCAVCHLVWVRDTGGCRRAHVAAAAAGCTIPPAPPSPRRPNRSSNSLGSGAEIACFGAIYISKRSLYQDRLGTNIGKALLKHGESRSKRGGFCRQCLTAAPPNVNNTLVHAVREKR